MKVFKKCVLVAAKKTKYAASLIAESFQAVYKELTTSNATDKNVGPTADKLSSALLITAKEIVDWGTVVAENQFLVTTVAKFLLIATICVGNLTELIEVAIDLHKGSLSEVAREIRNKSSQLQEEYDQWKKDFRDLPPELALCQ